MTPAPNVRAIKLASFVCGFAALGAILMQCRTPESNPNRSEIAADVDTQGNTPAALAAWDVVYRVLEHPRCMNCHPVGDAPLQGDQSAPHLQNVQRGSDGHGLYGMKCETCHQDHNLPGEHLPPGAPKWHLPSKGMPLVFEGKSSGELCRQLKDPSKNGGRNVEQVLEHIASDPLVMWGWDPGNGRAPVSTSHDAVVNAMRVWIDNGCGCPEK